MLYVFVLYSVVFYCIILYYVVLYCTIQYYNTVPCLMALCCTVQCCPVLSWIIFRERSLCNVDSCRFGLLVKILFVQGFSLTFGSELYVCVWCTYSCVCMYVRSEFKSSCLNGKHCADWMLFPVWVCIYITRMLAWDSRLCGICPPQRANPRVWVKWTGDVAANNLPT